ncbi:alpha/beta-hydrolase [Leucogyrophana mollusca]|uniref:Alpha/beta-hydrolase n=1 Tax=Leucogyrophana mollusca TaxID=85980 RepID=A0ACB8BFW5_9AGAM|nr:alpha/beta-hydrolase [Leucogyrophana mollusca]
MLNILPLALRFLLGSYLWQDEPQQSFPLRPPLPLSNTFRLRHQHAVFNFTRIIFSDIAPTSLAAETYRVNSANVQSHRPSSQPGFHSARFRSMRYDQSEKVFWDDVDVAGPDVQDRQTLLTLAKMTNNAYFEPGEIGWYDQSGWNTSYPFGWEPESDGFRGHVFVSDDNSTVILSIKGTSAGWLAGGGGPTVRKDKLNDNLLFSCCCARVGPTWSSVCDCHSGGYKCDQTCLERSLVEESLFYSIGTNLYNNVTYMYPDANIWIVGHSLGGALSSLLGVTFGAPVVAFEAPGEKLAASRLHLPSPPSTQHITHIYHTADPIAMGTCNGVTSTCAIGGYAMESRCHLGKVARYDTVSKLQWSVDVRTHPIKVIIEKLLAEDWNWEPANDTGINGTGRAVPMLVEEEDCMDCFNWEFGDFKQGPK